MKFLNTPFKLTRWFQSCTGEYAMKLPKQVLILLLCCLLVRFTAQAESFGPTGQSNEQSPAAPVQQSPQELQQLVAPIALYPDALVAQVLAGDTYANQQQDVTDAVQAMRQQAHKAGHLNSNEQEKVTTQGNTIIIEPANPEVVYVPAYDPWLVYGDPIVAYPGWYPVPGIFLAGPAVSFGFGFGIGFFGGFGWGWNHWGCDWHGHRVIYNHNTYISHSRTIINRNNFNRGRGNFNHSDAFN